MDALESSQTSQIVLTPHFKLSEFLHATYPIPEPWVLDNLYRLANRLQTIRDVFARPIIINSGYRSSMHNQQVGGVSHSQHLNGMAADIVVSGLPAAEVQAFLKNWSGGMGCYAHYTHLDIRPIRARWT